MCRGTLSLVMTMVTWTSEMGPTPSSSPEYKGCLLLQSRPHLRQVPGHMIQHDAQHVAPRLAAGGSLELVHHLSHPSKLSQALLAELQLGSRRACNWQVGPDSCQTWHLNGEPWRGSSGCTVWGAKAWQQESPQLAGGTRRLSSLAPHADGKPCRETQAALFA